MPNISVKEDSHLYVSGLGIQTDEIAAAIEKKIDILPGSARDTTNRTDIVLESIITIDIDRDGVNGIDNGVIVPDNLYHIHIIGDSTNKLQTGGLFSLSDENPLLPVGYDSFRKIGFVFLKPAGDITKFHQSGFGRAKVYEFVDATEIELVNAGAATVYTPVITSDSLLPGGCHTIIFNLTYTSAAPGNFAEFIPFNTAPVTGTKVGSAAAGLQHHRINIPIVQDRTADLNSGFFYRVIAGDLIDIVARGFIENI